MIAEPEPITAKSLNEQQAIMYIIEALTSKNLLSNLRCQVGTLLKENRRNQFSDYATSKGMLKGNRHIYGSVPFDVTKGIARYSESDLSEWVTTMLIPLLSKVA